MNGYFDKPCYFNLQLAPKKLVVICSDKAVFKGVQLVLDIPSINEDAATIKVLGLVGCSTSHTINPDVVNSLVFISTDG